MFSNKNYERHLRNQEYDMEKEVREEEKAERKEYLDTLEEEVAYGTSILQEAQDFIEKQIEENYQQSDVLTKLKDDFIDFTDILINELDDLEYETLREFEEEFYQVLDT